MSDFDQVVLSHVRTLEPRFVPLIHADVVSEWGETSDRRIYSALTRLRRRGLVRRTPDGYVLSKRGRRVS